MLGDFIRLTDYVAVEALVNLTVRTNEMFLTELLKPRKAGLFETTVLFTEEGTAFAPTCDDIKVRVHRGGKRGELSGRQRTPFLDRIRPHTQHFILKCNTDKVPSADSLARRPCRGHPITVSIRAVQHIAPPPFSSILALRLPMRVLPPTPLSPPTHDPGLSSLIRKCALPPPP